MTRQAWDFDPSHSSISFSVRHMVLSKVKGRFARWSGSFELDEENPAAARASVRIDASSIDTGVADRDTHLRSADFLDVAAHPELVFESKRAKRTGEGTYRLVGDLTIRGVTREVVLSVEDAGRGKDPWGNQRAGFSARTSLERKDFGLVWNQVLEAGGILVGDRIDIELELQAISKTAVKAA